jgi:hypothetical protein
MAKLLSVKGFMMLLVTTSPCAQTPPSCSRKIAGKTHLSQISSIARVEGMDTIFYAPPLNSCGDNPFSPTNALVLVSGRVKTLTDWNGISKQYQRSGATASPTACGFAVASEPLILIMDVLLGREHNNRASVCF